MSAVGAYITYSELFDRRPTWDEVTSLLKELPVLDALANIARINLSLRYALQEHNRPNWGRLQQTLVAHFVNDDTFKRLQERFAHVSTDDRPIFLPVNVLNLAKLVLIHSKKDSPLSTSDDPWLRYSIGTACLMLNDLLLSAEEEREITVGDRDVRRLALLVQMLAPFELANPPAAHHLLFRYQIIFRTLLAQQAVRQRISSACRNFDFAGEFRKLTGIELDRWLHIVFSLYAYFLNGGNVFDPRPEFFYFDPKKSLEQTQISEGELAAVLKTMALAPSDLAVEVGKERPTDLRFDFIPFRSFPMFRAGADRLACLDIALLLEKVHTGVHWVLHDAYANDPKKRDDLFQAWGILFEEYVHWLLDGIGSKLTVKYFRSPPWKGESESLDGILLDKGVFVPLEYKGGFLSRSARYSGIKEDFLEDVEEKFVPGCVQLAWKINALFGEDSSKTKSIEGVPIDQVRAIVPVLVLQDHILRVPFFNWLLNKRFQEQLSKYTLRVGTLVRPLSVVNISELETMVNSAEASEFDLVYALHHRAARDQEMLSNLQEFLMQFRTYGREQSTRTKRVYEELHGHMFSYLFAASK